MRRKDAQAPPAEIVAALDRMHLLDPGGALTGERLTGGVSSDIWRIDLPAGPICVKRALAKLRVVADWRAPIARNRFEAAWMLRANAAVPGAAPQLLGQDEESGALAMQYLSPVDHPLWKTELHAGRAEPRFAADVARRLVGIHAATAADPTVAAVMLFGLFIKTFLKHAPNFVMRTPRGIIHHFAIKFIFFGRSGFIQPVQQFFRQLVGKFYIFEKFQKSPVELVKVDFAFD